jgi:hypothetical protein
VTLPIPSNVFVDNQLIDEAGLYANVFTPINTIYSGLQLSIQNNGLAAAVLNSPAPSTGLLFTGGTVVFTAAAGGNTITYPNAFPNGVLTVLATPAATSGNPGAVQNQGVYTLTSFQIKVFTPSGTQITSGSVQVNWFAIGW